MGIKEDLQNWKETNPIRQYRKKEGLSQPDMAAILGVSGYTIQRWEDGAVNPSGENEMKLNQMIVGFSDLWNKWRKDKPGL